MKEPSEHLLEQMHKVYPKHRGLDFIFGSGELRLIIQAMDDHASDVLKAFVKYLRNTGTMVNESDIEDFLNEH